MSRRVKPVKSERVEVARSFLGRFRSERRRASAPTVSTAGRLAVESLEQRAYLTTLTAGPGQVQNFQYLDQFGQLATITFSDVTFEAIGDLVDPMTGQSNLADLVQPSNPPPPLAGSLFKIYVSSSHSDSFISIGQTDPTSGNLLDLTSKLEPFLVSDVHGQPFVAAIPSNTGGLVLGSLNAVAQPGPVAVASIPLTASFGVQPAPDNGILFPGIEVAPVDPATGLVNDFGNFLFGGTVTGFVSFGGSVNEFYAGNVLTGSVGGAALNTGALSGIAAIPNFTVAGDLRNFIVNGSVGTDGSQDTANNRPNQPLYSTDFDMTVGGKLGEFHVGNSAVGASSQDFAGVIQVGNSKLVSRQTAYPAGTTAPVLSLLAPQTEIETVGRVPANSFTGGGVDLRNDAVIDEQMLGSTPILDEVTGLPSRNTQGNQLYESAVTGTLQGTLGDTVDNYGLGIMAGQTFQFSTGSAMVRATLIDPDGRTVASTALSGATAQQYTADRPGIYTFQLTNLAAGTDQAYQLTITGGGGEMGVGAVFVNGFSGDNGFDGGIVSGFGDLGAFFANGAYISATLGPTPSSDTSVPLSAPSSISVPAGNLRALVAGALGERSPGNAAILQLGPTLNVPFGGVGLIQSNGGGGVDGVLNFASQFDPNYLNAPTPSFKTDDATATAIGGSIQAIDALTTYQANLATNKGLGALRAGDLATDTPSYFDVNADNTGQDGIIDLISCDGSFGDINGGGPQIVTGDGGNVRYLVLFGNIFRDVAFGGGQLFGTTYNAGQVVTTTDDGGATVRITPVGPLTTTTTTTSSTNSSSNFSSTNTTTATTGPTITLGTYPIRDKGGQAIVQMFSSGSMRVDVTGTAGANSSVDIGQMTINGTGVPVTGTAPDQFGNTGLTQAFPTVNTSSNSTTTNATSADGTTVTTTTTTTVSTTTNDLTLGIFGPAKVNIANLNINGSATSIVNNTQGEVASMFTNTTVGTILVHGNLGYTSVTANGEAPYARFQFSANSNIYPFVQQHFGVDLAGDTVAIGAYGGIGNVVCNGTIGSVIPNYAQSRGFRGTKPIPGQFSGIVGPIVAQRILFVNIGQGLLPTGTGLVGFDGIYATDKIGVINNFGNPDASIRGNVISADNDPTNVAINQILLSNGSIIGATVATITGTNDLNPATGGPDFSLTGLLSPTSFVLPDPQELPETSPYVYEIGNISVSGAGGIIGATVSAANIGPIIVTGGGFGILQSVIQSVGVGRIASVSASGYGIRETTIGQGGNIGQITATGNGSLIPTTAYPLDVRPGDNVSQPFDPFFGRTPDLDIDIDASLGLARSVNNLSDVTDTGVIEDDTITAQENLVGLTAFKARAALPVEPGQTILPNPATPRIPFIGQIFTDSIGVGRNVGTIHIRNVIDGLQVTAGSVGAFVAGSNVNRLGVSVAGKINAMTVHGNLGSTIEDFRTATFIPDSYVDAGGQNGEIVNLKVLGDVNANVTAVGRIDSMTVVGNVSGSITADGAGGGIAVRSLRVYGGIRDGALAINGSVGSFVVNGGLGSPTGAFTINGDVNLLSIGADRRRRGSFLQSALNISGSVNSFNVFGAITGAVTIGSNLNNFNLTGDGSTGNVLQSTFNVGGGVTNATVTNGSITGAFTANNDIQKFTIVRGNLAAGGVVQSQIAGVKNFRITGGSAYNLFGSVLAPSGLDDSVDVSGNVGDGTHPAAVTASTASTIRVRGSVFAESTITVSGAINLLRVDGTVNAGATIIGNPIRRRVIAGNILGTVTG